MAAIPDPQISSLEKQRSALNSTLSGSPTYASGAAPTSSDLSTQSRLNSLDSNLEKLKSDQLKKQWYGEDKGTQGGDTEGSQPGVVGRVLHALSTPLYGVVGGVEALTGQGTKKGLANIAANIDEKDTFSDLLKRNHVPYLLSAPLGFALDVAFDPVNWATAGTAAIVPRAAYGLAKGGLEGAAKGVGYSLASGGSKALALVGAGKTGLRQTLKENAVRYASDFDNLTGRNIIERATGGSIPGIPALSGVTDNPYRYRVGNVIEQTLNKIPGGDRLFKAFNYDSAGWVKYSKWQDTLERAYGPGAALPDAPTVEEAQKFVEGIPITSPEARARADEMTGLADEGKLDMNNLGEFKNMLPMSELPRGVNPGTVAARADSLAADTNFIVGNPEAVATLDPIEHNARLMEEATAHADDSELMQQLMEEYKRDKNATGIKFFDNARQRVKDFKVKDVNVGSGVLNGLNSFMQAFKLSKLGLSPATHFANAASGIPLGMMAGLSMVEHNPGQFFSKLKLLSGSPKAANEYIKRLGDQAEQGARIIQYMKEHGGTWEAVYGESPEYLLGKGFVDQIIQSGRDAGLVNAKNQQEVVESLDQYMLFLRDKLRDIESTQNAEGLMGIVKNAKKKAAASPGETARRRMDEGLANPDTVAMTGAEFNDESWFRDKLRDISDAAQEENAGVGVKVLDTFLNKSMTMYGRIDQAWRMTFFDWMTLDGLSEKELRTMGNIFPFKDGDIVSKLNDANGKQRFLIHPDKATEVAADILFNYAAMPAAVRMLRSTPILGAPFASFMYGMAVRTAQTMAYNPAAFNRINFALDSVAGTKDPIEKKALDSQFYSWYNDPTMLRLPFFDKFPLYLNMANVLPYYSMNIFEPPQRKYQETLPQSVAQLVDKSPFLKDPIGQMLFDYFIMPSMIRDERPLNSFGQPIYPEDATTAQKLGYAARSAADMLTPNLVAPAGMLAPESAAQYLPGYRTRQMAEAVQGKNSLGIIGKEDPASRTLRALAGLGGLPVQRLDPSAAESDLKKNPPKQ